MTRKLIYIIGLVIALIIPQKVEGQYINRKGSSFINQDGIRLSDSELIGVFGSDIYLETIVGARKQYNIGRQCILAGSILSAVGIAGSIYESSIGFDTDFGLIMTYLLLYGGGAALDVGFPLYFIGKSRLVWAESYVNASDYSMVIGPTSNGIGLSIKF
jgi:hypothetical protein